MRVVSQFNYTLKKAQSLKSQNFFQYYPKTKNKIVLESIFNNDLIICFQLSHFYEHNRQVLETNKLTSV